MTAEAIEFDVAQRYCPNCELPVDACACHVRTVADPRGLLSEPHDGTLRQP